MKSPAAHFTRFVPLIAVVALTTLAQDQIPPTSPAKAPPGEDPAYTRVIEGRTTAILDLLKLTDAGQTLRVHDAIMAHYRGLNAWQNAHETRHQALKKAANDPDPEKAAEARKAIEALRAPIDTAHREFVAKLEADLTPAQVETVKDKLTYNKVQVTYDGYVNMLPDLTGDQKAKILALLKEARELAIDGMDSDEKTAIFGKYKGRINNYLSAEGYDLKQASQAYNERLRARSGGNR